MTFWIKGKEEVEIVDFLIQVKESMVNVSSMWFTSIAIIETDAETSTKLLF